MPVKLWLQTMQSPCSIHYTVERSDRSLYEGILFVRVYFIKYAYLINHVGSCTDVTSLLHETQTFFPI